jgi:hypothetical protein
MIRQAMKVACSMCDAERDVPYERDGNRLMKHIFAAGYHVVHIEPPVGNDHHSHSIVCSTCALRIDGRKPS